MTATSNELRGPASSSGQKKLPRRHRIAGVIAPAISVAMAALLPKCFGCVAGYLALASGLGLAGREICGGATAKPPDPALFAVIGGGLWFALRRLRLVWSK